MLKNRLYRHRTFIVVMSVVVELGIALITVGRASAATLSSWSQQEQLADLYLTMTDTPDPVNVGETLTYTLRTQNVGIFDASNVVLTDTLPTTVTLQSVVVTQGSCIYGQIVRCALGDIDSGDEASVTIKVTPNQQGTITNRGVVYTPDFDDPGNNSAQTDTTVLGNADVGVVITGTPNVVNINAPLTYTVSVSNSGPQSANQVQVITELATQVTLQSVSASQGTCSGTTTIDCALGTLADDANAQITIVVIPHSEGVITTNTSVTTRDHDNNSANDESTVTTTVQAVVDVGVEKTVTPESGVVDDVFSYQMRVFNEGPQRADDVVMTDTVPSGLTIQDVTTTQGSCSQNGNTVRCTIGSIPNNADVRITVNARAEQVGTFTNTAVATTSDFDFDPSNNDDDAQITVSARKADLAVSMTADPQTGNVGDSFTYNVSVRNDGPQEAESTRLTTTLPSGVTLQNVTASQGGCLGDPIIICNFGTVNEDQTVTVAIQVRADVAGTLTATSITGSDTSDPNTGNNSASASITVQGVADLSVTMTDTPDPVGTGSLLRYNIIVRNDGPQAAMVTFTDTLPTQVDFISASPTTGSCSGDSTIVCDLGVLSNDQEVAIEILVRPSTLGNITNTVVVASDVFDPNTGNNSASVQTTVQTAKLYLPVVYSAPTCTITEVEPNDTADDVQTYLPLCRAATLHGTVPEGDASDIYPIQVDSTTQVTIRLSDIPDGTDYDLFLYNANREQIAESRNIGTADEEIVIPLTPGLYYIRIYTFEAGRSTEPYALRWE